jgi:hypothetical protein
MRKFTFTLLLSMLTLGMFAQLVNDGATITIKPGATLFVETDVTNNATGTINIEGNGILEVQGNLTNAGNLNTSSTSKVKFTGALASNLNAGNDSIANLELAKTAAVNVSLTGGLVVKNNLDFNSASASKLSLGTNTITLAAAATTTGADADEYIVTGAAGVAGTGTVKKNYAAGALASSLYKFEVGDATAYSPLESTITGTAAASASLSVKANDITHPNKPADADAYISRYWDVDALNMSPYSNALKGTFAASDINGTPANIKGASYETSSWSYAGAGGTASTDVTGTTGAATADFSGTNFYGKLNLRMWLAGPYNTSTHEMNTSLNAPSGTNWLETSALTSPYNASPYNASPASVSAGFFLANPTIVDWVMLELRDPATPTVATTNRSSAFIKKDGTVVGLDGTSNPTVKGGLPTSVLAIYHRNHLTTRTKNNGINVINPTLLDMRTDTTQIYKNIAITTNVPLKTVETGPNIWGMWEGDVVKDGILKYNLSNNDRAAIYTAIGGASQNATVTGYRVEDVNMDGIVKYNLSNNDRAIIYTNIGGASQNATITQHN